MDEDQHSAAGIRPGDILAGKYRVERVLGVGGMGVVVAAHHLQLDEKVALKFLLTQALESPDAVARFDREARAAVKIKSEHVARVIDVGRLESGAPYMVMEYLDGGDLAAWLTQRGALPVEVAVDFVLQACEAIAEAHALGIIHRDLKPSNLFCVRRADGRLAIKVLDFGISKVTATGGSIPDMVMTRTTALVGSPLYMSPEQLQASKNVDVRSDIWSLGVILYEILSGRPPFLGEAVTDLAIKIATEPPPPPRTIRADLPPGLEQIVLKCLEKDRARRYQNVAELAIALVDYASMAARPSVDRILGTLRMAGAAGGAGLAPSTTAPQPPARTSDAWGNTGAGTRAGKSKATATILLGVAAAVLLLALSAAGIGLFVSRRAASRAAAAGAGSGIVSTPPVDAASAISSAPPETSTTNVALAPSASGSAAAVATASAAPSATVAATASKSVAAPPPTATATGGKSNAITTPTAVPPKANCDPPYYIDSAGHRQYKPACL